MCWLIAVAGLMSPIEQIALAHAHAPSRSYTVQVEVPGRMKVCRLPVTGSDAVLDAVASVAGELKLPLARLQVEVWRQHPAGKGNVQVLPVDWVGITQNGDTKTNYQLLAGDTIAIKLRARP